MLLRHGPFSGARSRHDATEQRERGVPSPWGTDSTPHELNENVHGEIFDTVI